MDDQIALAPRDRMDRFGTPAASNPTPVVTGTYSSLDVELNEHLAERKELLFIAPRGEVSITAQAFSDPLLERMKVLGIVLAALLAVWLVARYGIAALDLVWHEGSWPAWISLLLLTLLAMYFQFFAVAAVALFVILVVLAIILKASRRAATT